MRSVMNVSLPQDLKRWVDEQVKEGGYGTASEYLRDMLRRAREREARRKIDDQLIEAVRSGASVEMNDADWTSLRKAARAAVKTTKVKR
jgi:antitoxin ParD1/3/4